VLLTPGVVRRRKERSGTLIKDGLIFASMIGDGDDEDGDEDELGAGGSGIDRQRGRDSAKDFDYRFYYRPLEGAAAEEEDGLALVSLERSLSASAVDLAISPQMAAAASSVAGGGGVFPPKSGTGTGTGSGTLKREKDEGETGPLGPSMSVDTTEPADSPESDASGPVGLQLSPDLPMSFARPVPSVVTGQSILPSSSSGKTEGEGEGENSAVGGAKSNDNADGHYPSPQPTLGLRQRLAAKLGLREFSEDPNDRERGSSSSPARFRAGRQQYVDRDLFDSTGFYVGLSDRGGARVEGVEGSDGDSEGGSSSRVRLGSRTGVKVDAIEADGRASAAAAREGGRSASESSDSTTEDLVSLSNLPDSREGSLSLPLGGMATMPPTDRGRRGGSEKISPSIGFRAGSGGAKRKPSTRPSMIRVGSSSVSLNYLSALADAGKDKGDEDRDGVWGGGGT
jgi:hypothetical protein